MPGAGFSGTLQAINLVRHGGPKVTLIERADAVARGVAYPTRDPAHLLNVRASNMSAFSDEPDHFLRWRAARDGVADSAFASRRDYGDYLAGCCQAFGADFGAEAVSASELVRLLPGYFLPIVHAAPLL